MRRLSRRASPYDGVTYEDPGVNPIADPDEDRVSTFALDVDTASYTIAQRYVADGNVPDPASVRVEEWVNAFDQGYRAPDDDTFAIFVDGGPTPFIDRDEVLLRGSASRPASRRDRARQDAALTFVIDTSGSMDRENRLELVKDALRKLVASWRGDPVAIVTFGDDARVVLPPTRPPTSDAILDAIDRLQPGGSTNLEAGLRLGYELARDDRSTEAASTASSSPRTAWPTSG